MQVLTQESQKFGLLPAITNSKETGVHTSIFIPLEEGSTNFSIRSIFDSLYQEASGLLQKSMRRSEAEIYLKPVKEVLSSYQSMTGVRGIAIFRSRNAFYHTFLHEPPPQLVVVASSFHIKPLIHCISTRAVCFALTITSRQLKVFKVDGDQASLVQKYSNEFDEVEGKREGGFIGQRKRNKEVIERFVRDVTGRLVKEFKLRRCDVAVLGPKSLRKRLIMELSAKAQVQTFYDTTIFSSIGEMSKTLETALKLKNKERSQKFVNRVAKSSDKSLMTPSLQDIATAAVQGRIERLMIDPSVQIWGLLDRSSGLITTHAEQTSDEDDCVIDDITEEVIKKGGDVVFFDSTRLENVAPYLATLRW